MRREAECPVRCMAFVTSTVLKYGSNVIGYIGKSLCVWCMCVCCVCQVSQPPFFHHCSLSNWKGVAPCPPPPKIPSPVSGGGGPGGDREQPVSLQLPCRKRVVALIFFFKYSNSLFLTFVFLFFYSDRQVSARLWSSHVLLLLLLFSHPTPPLIPCQPG